MSDYNHAIASIRADLYEIWTVRNHWPEKSPAENMRPSYMRARLRSYVDGIRALRKLQAAEERRQRMEAGLELLRPRAPNIAP